MNAAERGILLLCCALGQPAARPLTAAAYRDLGLRARAVGPKGSLERTLEPEDLTRIGCSAGEAAHVLGLLDRGEALERYLEKGRLEGLFPLTCRSEGYPQALWKKKGPPPPVFFCAGNTELLRGPFAGLAGSRRLTEAGRAFARRAGELAAAEGYVLVTGGAEGADRTAMEACMQNGGRTLTFVPDDLRRRAREAGPKALLLSAGGYDLAFSPARALSRNASVHKLGKSTLIPQVTEGRGGTWSGCVQNLQNGWSALYVHEDGSPGAAALIARGATGIGELKGISCLTVAQEAFF